MNETVGIIMRTQNRPLLLTRAIESVCNQTYPDWKLVIVNDGGNEETVNGIVDKISSIFQKKIQVIHNEKPSGMEAASNRGIKAISTKYLVIHDDDDTWNKDFLKIMTSALDDVNKPAKSVKGVVCKSVKITESLINNSIIRQSVIPTGISLNKGILNSERILRTNAFYPISFLYYYDCINEIGYYDESLPVLGDWDFNVRFLQKYDILVLPDYLARYHVRPKSTLNYGNSIVAGNSRHAFYDQLIRNKWLRSDFQSGKIGVGFFANLSQETSILSYLAKIKRAAKCFLFERKKWKNC